MELKMHFRLSSNGKGFYIKIQKNDPTIAGVGNIEVGA
jgi:hypothetical protein